MIQIFGLEFLSFPPPPQNLGAEGVLEKIDSDFVDAIGFTIKTWPELLVALREFRREKFSSPILFLISGHGAEGKIALGLKEITLDEIFASNPGLFANSWVHLSYCQSLTLSEDIRIELVNKYRLIQLSGYKRQPIWEESYLLDLEVARQFIIEYS